MEAIMKNLKVLWTTMTLQMKNSFVRPMFRFCLLANPLVNTILLYEMFINSGQINFINYVILGAGLMGIWSCICFSSAGDINRERWYGTLSIIYTAPADFRLVIIGKILGNTILSLITFAVSFAAARLFFKGNFYAPQTYQFLISFISMILSFVVIAVFLAYLLTLSRKTTLYMNLIEYPVILVCGFVFPVDILPNWVQKISFSLPPTWAVKLLRMSVAGEVETSIFLDTFYKLVFITGIYVIIVILLYKIINKQVRKLGTLEMQ